MGAERLPLDVRSRSSLLPPRPDVCQVCARDHEPHEPHDATSLYWHTARELAGKPAPTWADALAHVAEPLRSRWEQALAARGIVVAPARLSSIEQEVGR